MLIEPYNKPIPNYLSQHNINSRFNDKNIYIVLPDLNPFYVFDDNINIKKVSEYIPSDILSKVFNKEIILAFETTTESIYRHIDILYDKLIVAEGIPESQILIISSSIDIHEKILDKSKKVGKKSCLFENYMYFEDVTNYIVKRDLPENYRSPLLNNNHQRRYINLNGRWREHRVALLTLLNAHGLIEYGHNSFHNPTNYFNKPIDDAIMVRHENLKAIKVNTKISGDLWFNYSNDDSIDDLWNLWIAECKTKFNDSTIHNLLDKGYDVHKLIPMYVDKSGDSSYLFDHNLPSGFFTILAHYYHKSMFSLVTDTFYFNKNPRLITEKTMKPIAFKHPFILLAPPNSLDELRKIGYKTFHPYINESYDLEYDDNKRLLMVLQEIQRLCNIEGIELLKFKENLLKVVDHNYKLLYNKTNFLY